MPFHHLPAHRVAAVLTDPHAVNFVEGSCKIAADFTDALLDFLARRQFRTCHDTHELGGNRGDVAPGEDAYEDPALDHGQASDFAVSHHPRGLGDICIWADRQ